MATKAPSLQSETRVSEHAQAAHGLALVRMTVEAMFVWVFCRI